MNAAIRRLRETLDDSAEHPRFIETLPRRGYRFIASVAEGPVEHSGLHSLPEGLAAAAPLESVERPQTAKHSPTWWQPTLRLAVTFAVGMLAIVTALSLGARTFRQRATLRQEPSVERLTSLGTIRLAAISADGQTLAYSRTDGARESLWIQVDRSGGHVRLVPPVAGNFRSITVAPGGYVYYTLFQPDRTHVALYRVAIEGGSAQMLPEPAGPISFSADGSRFAYVSTTSIGVSESRVVVAGVDGNSNRVLAVCRPPVSFINVKPAWSHDGSRLTVMTRTSNWSRGLELVTLRVVDGTERARTRVPLAAAEGLVELPDGSHVVAARERPALPLQLWRVDRSSRALRRLTHDVSDYWLAGVRPDGRLVAVRSETARALWAGELHDLAHVRQVAADSGSLEGFEGLAWTPDAHILYPAAESGNLDLWALEPSSGVRRRLTSDPAADFHPSVSADGRIAFASDRGGTTAIWIMSGDGASPRRLTNGPHIRPAMSPDGQWVAVQQMSVESIPQTLWRVRVDDGRMMRLGPAESIRPAISPDGRFVAHYWMTSEQWTLAVSPVEGGLPVRTLAIQPTHSERVVRWGPDGEALAFIDAAEGSPNIWLQPLDDAPAKPLTHLENARIATFDWSRDGSRLAWTTVTEVRDVVMVTPGSAPGDGSLN